MKCLSLSIFLLSLCSFVAFGQEKTNVAKLKEESIRLNKVYRQQQEEAKKYADLHKLPLRGYDTRGRVFWLHHIENGRPVYYTARNAGSATSMQVDKLWTGGSLGLNLNGQGMEVSVSRSRMGLWEPGVPRTTHQEFGGRLIIRDASTFSGPSSDNQHATHVAGTMMAAGVNANAKGMAHQAKMDSHDAFNDLSEMNTAASEGMLISNHSYGPSFPAPTDYWTRGYYDTEAQNWDNLCYNAPYYLPVQACGNDRNDDTPGLTYDLLLGSSNAKNSLGIGAVEKLATPYSSPASVVMSDFSSYGPTDDGRIKPDLVAPGVQIFSCDDATDNQYTNLDGTSMAGPGAAGALFLLQQRYKDANSNFMRAATLRALAIHTAEECGTTPGPDYAYGWGLINAARAVEVINNTGGGHILSEHTLNNASTYTQSITVPGGQPLRVTICWTDPAATPLPDDPSSNDDRTSRLVNDLDLRVKNSSNVDIELPWKLDPNNPSAAATHGDNTVDNVEQIYVATLAAGTYTITVTHKGTLTSGSQAFSLVVTGVSAAPTIPATPTSLTATATSSSQINLAWTDAANNEDGFKVERSPDGLGNWTEIASSLPANTTTYSDNGLNPATTYYYRVRAYNAAGNSSYSNIANATTQNAAPTAIKELIDLGISVSPNPVSSQLFVEAKNLPKNSKITLRNALGQVVSSKILDQHASILDVRSLPKGLYIVEFEGVKNRVKIVVR